MKKLIYAEELIERIATISDLRKISTATLGMAITECTPVEAEPVVHGKWLLKIVQGARFGECSECRSLGSFYWKRCPYCEAKMDGDVV